MTSFRCVAAVLMMVVCAAASGQQRNINFDLLQAARSGSVGAVRTLLDEGANPNSRNRLGDTPLNTAARNGQIELVQLLIERGADVNLASGAERTSALVMALTNARFDVGKYLIEEEAIRVQIRSQPGTRLNEETVDSDVRALYRMGFFDDVKADLNEENGKWVLTYTVTERPLIHEVHIEGNKKISREDLDGAFKIRPNTIFEPDKVRHGIDEAKKLYEKKGYLDAKITYDTTPQAQDEVILTYKIDEGKIVRITDLIFEGARAFKEKRKPVWKLR